MSGQVFFFCLLFGGWNARRGKIDFSYLSTVYDSHAPFWGRHWLNVGVLSSLQQPDIPFQLFFSLNVKVQAGNIMYINKSWQQFGYRDGSRLCPMKVTSTVTFVEGDKDDNVILCAVYDLSSIYICLWKLSLSCRDTGIWKDRNRWPNWCTCYVWLREFSKISSLIKWLKIVGYNRGVEARVWHPILQLQL